MSLQTLSEWLRCPNCFCPMEPRAPLTLTCQTGHSFDVNKRGFVSLLLGSRNHSGDNTAMLNARDDFLGAGWYEPLRDAIANTIAAETPSRVLDVGCGTGYYLSGIISRRDDTRALGMDLSPVAVARTVRRQDHFDGLVADVWSLIPVRDASADVILNVFAPRNVTEFHRIRRQNGLLTVVIPRETHLRELRDAGLAINVHAKKSAQLITSLTPYFDLESQQELSWVLSLSPDDVAALIGMGPSALHTDTTALPEDDRTRQPVTAAFELLGFRRRTG